MQNTFDVLRSLATLEQQTGMHLASFAAGQTLAEADTPVRSAIILLTGIVSGVIKLDGQAIDVGMAGPEVVIGFSDRPLYFATWIARQSGHLCAMPINDFTAIQDKHAIFRDIVQRGDRFMQTQAQQLAACNSQHKASERLASFLLRARNRYASNEIWLTQDVVASALGVQRASVSHFAGEFADERIISYVRGRIQILDIDALEAKACECHRAIQLQYQSIFTRSK